MKMTIEQKNIAEQNHDLIYYFLRRKELSDDYYDIVAIGLCQAAISYDSSKGRFSTFAYKCMNNEMCKHYTYLKRKKFIPEELIESYDREIFEGQDGLPVFMIDYCISDKFDVAEYVVKDIFIDSLRENERKVVEYFKDGMTQQEIAKELNKTQQAISLTIKNVKRKWCEYVDNN